MMTWTHLKPMEKLFRYLTRIGEDNNLKLNLTAWTRRCWRACQRKRNARDAYLT